MIIMFFTMFLLLLEGFGPDIVKDWSALGLAGVLELFLELLSILVILVIKVW